MEKKLEYHDKDANHTWNCKFKNQHFCYLLLLHYFCATMEGYYIAFFLTFTITRHKNSNRPMFRSAQTDSELTAFKDQIMQEKQFTFLSISGSLKNTLKRYNEHGGVWNGLNNFL